MSKLIQLASLAIITALLSPAAVTAGDPPKVDVNKATLAQLIELPGIGPKVAERIVAYREQNGGFRSVDELTQVRGIGPKVLEKLRPFVTVTTSGNAGAKSKAAPGGDSGN